MDHINNFKGGPKLQTKSFSCLPRKNCGNTTNILIAIFQNKSTLWYVKLIYGKPTLLSKTVLSFLSYL